MRFLVSYQKSRVLPLKENPPHSVLETASLSKPSSHPKIKGSPKAEVKQDTAGEALGTCLAREHAPPEGCPSAVSPSLTNIRLTGKMLY